MRRTMVMWPCPNCGHSVRGDIREPPYECPECRADMAGSQPDGKAAINAYYCMMFHERNEEARIRLPRIPGF